jgi:hypothetical protein
VISYDRLISLSGLCCNRKLALNHYKGRLDMIYKNNWDRDTKHEPDWARRMGYEPGTKKIRRGGYFNDNFDVWHSEFPQVDIRHNGTFSKRKVHLEDFKHLPNNWVEATLDQVPGWNLKEMFKL